MVRQLSQRLTPVDLYAALSDGGRRDGTCLLETIDRPEPVARCRRRAIECRGVTVEIHALSAGGRNLIEAAAQDAGAACRRARRRCSHASLPRTNSDDSEERLQPVGPLTSFASRHRHDGGHDRGALLLACLASSPSTMSTCSIPFRPPPRIRSAFPRLPVLHRESLIVFEAAHRRAPSPPLFGAPGEGSGLLWSGERLADLVRRW